MNGRYTKGRRSQRIGTSLDIKEMDHLTHTEKEYSGCKMRDTSLRLMLDRTYIACKHGWSARLGSAGMFDYGNRTTGPRATQKKRTPQAGLINTLE